MKVSFNMSAIIANNALADSDNALSKSLERLSSGLKINHAKDNAAGLAIAKRMNAQIEGLGIATQNASDGISVIEIAEGALAEIQSMFQRMTELSVKSANGVMTDNDRTSIQAEIDQLQEEITRIANETEFNGQSLLDGSFDLRGYSNSASVKFTSYSDDVPVGFYGVRIDAPAVFDADGNVVTNAQVTLEQLQTEKNCFPPDAQVTTEGNKVFVKASNGFEINFDITEKATTPGEWVNLEAKGIGAMRLQIGANEGQVLELRIPTISLENMGLDKIKVTSQEDAKAAIANVEFANSFVSGVRARLGAYQNRLEHSTSSLDISSENMTAAYSRIMDVNMATEMTEYTKYQVMTQAGTSMVAQANERPQQVLQLLQ